MTEARSQELGPAGFKQGSGVSKRTETENGRNGERGKNLSPIRRFTDSPIRFSFLLLLTAYCLLFTVTTGCGKKAPPKPPQETALVKITKKIDKARRMRGLALRKQDKAMREGQYEET